MRDISHMQGVSHLGLVSPSQRTAGPRRFKLRVTVGKLVFDGATVRGETVELVRQS